MGGGLGGNASNRNDKWYKRNDLNNFFIIIIIIKLLGPELFFFLILAHPVYKMWIIREPNKLELRNKLHFEEEKKRTVYTLFKILSTYICWINI